MIEPVSRVQNYTTQRVGAASGKNTGGSGAAPFSMDQALAEESAKDEGVYYDHAPKTENKESKPSPEPAGDAIIEKPGPEAPLGAIDTKNLVKGIKEFLSGLWANILRIFGNIWESKPLNDGAPQSDDGKSETIRQAETGEIDPLHEQDSLNFHKGTDKEEFSSIPDDDFDKNIDSLSEDHIKPFEDRAIKDALLSGDDEKFEKIITRGGERRPAISSNLLTQYDSKGRIIQMDPSDENLILHGTSRTNRNS
ncbi:MAG: hypothetical protein J5696_05420 [Lachnospiraceae bacterium]|nr:hypothetical protein [Lachnospiraceae bacterium]